MIDPSFRFYPVAELDARARQAAARLVYESFVEFYDLLPLALEDRIAAISDQFELSASELGATVVACHEGEVVGIHSALAAKRLQAAQLAGVASFARGLSREARQNFRTALDHFSGEVPPVPEESFYLARFAVAAERRGSGLAAKLLDHFVVAGRGSACYSVHARCDNTRALRFYQKHGLAHCSEGPTAYVSLCRSAGV